MLELLQQLTLPHVAAILAGGFLIYHFFIKKTGLSAVALPVPSETTLKINNVLAPPNQAAAQVFEQKKVVGLVSEWADLRDAAVASGATEAVKKLDELFPLLNKTETSVTK
jgi:hypothetical protein